MTDKFLTKLSQNLLEILDDEEYYDIIIEVGNDPYVKIFRAHMVILNYRSSYLRRILSTNKKENDETLVHIKLPNISPEIFEIILRYIYGGKLSFEEYDTSDIVKVLVAASELNLQELANHLQSSLIENNAKWVDQNLDLIYRTSFENGSFLELQKYCTDLFSKDPDNIFKSPNFSTIPEKLLITLIQSDNLQMSEIQVWEHVLKWGFSQNPALPSDLASFSKDEFNVLKNTLQQCIPLIKFFNFNSKEFLDRVMPYKKALPKELYKDLIKHFLDPNLNPNDQLKFKTNETNGINSELQATKVDKKIQLESHMTEVRSESQMTEVRSESQMTEVRSESQMTEVRSESQMTEDVKDQALQINQVAQSALMASVETKTSNIDSKIISVKHAEVISKWVDRANNHSIFSSWIYTPKLYKFKLLFRGTRDGFTPSNFHQICDDQSSTVIIIKVRDSSEILGGYNPIEWKSDYSCGVTNDSFIFSFGENDILSRVSDEEYAIVNSPNRVSSFGNGDLVMSGFNFRYSSCKKNTYEKPIRETEDIFSVEEYEVFQIIKD